jgi:hypothetical protein
MKPKYLMKAWLYAGLWNPNVSWAKHNEARTTKSVTNYP